MDKDSFTEHQKALQEGLFTGFFDSSCVSMEEYQPRLLFNDNKRGQKVLASIIEELRKCREFLFSVAFITNSGVAILINTLRELEEKGIPGRIIASQYQNFTEPRALRRLSSLKNVEVRVATEGNHHAKGYLFRGADTDVVIVGSSNLTQSALSLNNEWNVRLSTMEEGSLIQEIMGEFERDYAKATPVTEPWLADYEIEYERHSVLLTGEAIEMIDSVSGSLILNKSVDSVEPNTMQREALVSLQRLREENKDKALLISATGTGKTYLAAFDAKKMGARRLLFVVHRETIARAAMQSFRRIFGEDVSMSVLGGRGPRNTKADFQFATIQTLSKEETLSAFGHQHFDYVVIDEVHRAGAATYRKILDHFTPSFLLGMSATPERTDGYDIFREFDYNIAYEIRLNDALEENMLSPFHYYGISDIEVDGELLDDHADFRKLTCPERVAKVLHFADFYGCDRGRIKGLIFCSRNEEAKELSGHFNERGYRTIALSGESSQEQREESIRRLEMDAGDKRLDYIFSVDIFNEGVDIPAINQIIMLRPTQSAIIFVQQLGRGLRKLPGKEYLTVLDFIGNYSNNYIVPIALYGDQSYNKDTIRRLINSESSFIPGVSTINFDRITKERIFSSINQTNLSQLKLLKEDYQLLKYKLGRIPLMRDFQEHGSRDPYAFVEYKGSYYAFLKKVETDYDADLSEKEERMLSFLSKEVCNGKRVEDCLLLEELLEQDRTSLSGFLEKVEVAYGRKRREADIDTYVHYLNQGFLKEDDRRKYNVGPIVKKDEGFLYPIGPLQESKGNAVFREHCMDTVGYSIKEYDKKREKKDIGGFFLHEKYTRKDVCRILGWKKDVASILYGYRIMENGSMLKFRT